VVLLEGRVAIDYLVFDAVLLAQNPVVGFEVLALDETVALRNA